MAIEIPIAFDADTSDLTRELDKAADAGERVSRSISGSLSAELDQSADSARRFAISSEGAAEGADSLASGSSQAAGGLGDLGGALSLIPGPLGGLGAGMELAAPAIMGVTGAADLVNLALDKLKLGMVAGKIATAAKTAVDVVATTASNVLAVAIRGVGLAVRFATGPFGLILLAITAAVAGLVLAYKKSETFRNIVNGAFKAVQRVAESVFNWIKNNWPLLVGVLFGPVGIAVALIIKHFDKVKAFVQALPDVFLKSGKAMMDALFEGLKSAAGAVGGVAADIAGAVKDAINDLLNLPLDIGPVKALGKTIIPEITIIPRFAAGTDFAPGGVALVGEEGPELVNLPRGSQVLTASQTRDAVTGGDVIINQNYFGPTTSAGRLREIDWTLRFATGRLPRQSLTSQVA